MNLILHDLETNVQEKLRELARSHGRSLEEEAREILRNAVVGQNALERVEQGLGSQIVSRFSGSGISMDETVTEFRGHAAVAPELDS